MRGDFGEVEWMRWPKAKLLMKFILRAGDLEDMFRYEDMSIILKTCKLKYKLTREYYLKIIEIVEFLKSIFLKNIECLLYESTKEYLRIF